jgi:hypothetical protein
MVVDSYFHRIDFVIVSSHFLASPAVTVDQCLQPALKLLFNQSAHLQGLSPNNFQFIVESAKDMMSKIGIFHNL